MLNRGKIQNDKQQAPRKDISTFKLTPLFRIFFPRLELADTVSSIYSTLTHMERNANAMSVVTATYAGSLNIVQSAWRWHVISTTEVVEMNTCLRRLIHERVHLVSRTDII